MYAATSVLHRYFSLSLSTQLYGAKGKTFYVCFLNGGFVLDHSVRHSSPVTGK